MNLPERFQQQPRSQQLTDYINRKYSKHGYLRQKAIGYNSEFSAEGSGAYRDSYRWVENVNDGLREVGAAHDIVRLNHTGWYIDNEHFETVHGMVYQLPARDGECYVPGVDDPFNKNCACLDFHSITGDKEQAARWADSMAENWAEREREYQAKQDAEQRLEEIEEEIKSEFNDFRRIAKELRADCDKLKGIAVVRELVRERWQRTKAAIHKLRSERSRIEQHGMEY